MSNTNSILSFLVRHPEYSIKSIESQYPFSKNQLTKFSNRLNWHRISLNTNIGWGSDVLNDFKDKLDWSNVSINPSVFKKTDLIKEFEELIDWKGDQGMSIASNIGIPWSIELIDNYKNKLNFEQLSENESIPWTENLIIQYYDRWHFPYLSQNNALPWSLVFFEKYFVNSNLPDCYFALNETFYGVFEIVDRWHRFLDWHHIWANSRLPWIEKDLMNRWKDYTLWHSIASNEFLLSLDSFLKNHMYFFKKSKYSFHNLTSNEGINWTADLIERYKDRWDWDRIYWNKSIPWSIELIDKYSDLLRWGYYEEYRKVEDLTEEQKKEKVSLGRSHSGLTENPALPWSIDFILYYENELDDELLYCNTKIWEKAFKPFVDDKIIETVYKIL